jgi:two-component SAPR family response regulator
MKKPLDGLKILIVEDEFLASLEISAMIETLGGAVVGPTGRLDEAQALADQVRIDGAVLDVKLSSTTSLPLAEDLTNRGIPFILATGYERDMLPVRYAEIPRLTKPFDATALKRIAMQTFRRRLHHNHLY